MKFRDGVCEFDLRFWDDFYQLLNKKVPIEDPIYRGHSRKSYQLESSFVRACKLSGVDADTPLRNKHLNNFRMAIRGRINFPDQHFRNDDEIWALGQHHGLTTPLLDWTESPFVAAYFAFLEPRIHSKDTEERSIFILSRKLLNKNFHKILGGSVTFFDGSFIKELKSVWSLFEHVSEFSDKAISILRVITREIPSSHKFYSQCLILLQKTEATEARIIEPISGENPRLVSQRGIFTKLVTSANSLEQWVQNKFKGTNDRVLIKINIPDYDRMNCIKYLNRMNINPLSLFPDLNGSSLFCNEQLKTDGKPFDWSIIT